MITRPPSLEARAKELLDERSSDPAAEALLLARAQVLATLAVADKVDDVARAVTDLRERISQDYPLDFVISGLADAVEKLAKR